MWKQLCSGGRGTALCQGKPGQLCHFLAGDSGLEPDFGPRYLCLKNGGDLKDSIGELWGKCHRGAESPGDPACGKYFSCTLGGLREELGEHINPQRPAGWPQADLRPITELLCFLICKMVMVTASFPGGQAVKNPPANAEDVGSIPGSGRVPWRRKWQPTPVFLPRRSHGWRGLVGYSPRGHRRMTGPSD